MLNGSVLTWRHIFKLDPDRSIGDEALERICMSGTDGIIVGGSTGVTYENTVDLLSRIRRFVVPCVLEVSDAEAIVPGFDEYLIPIVLNTSNPKWLIGHHHRAIRNFGSMLPWDAIVGEGYIILNPESAAARVTEADAGIDEKDVLAYAQLADKLLRLPIVYLEYSGTFGDMDLVMRVKQAMNGARLLYGGGIDGCERAREALQAADTIVVGNLIYDDLEQALETVHVARTAMNA